jgi:fatty acid desaturase
MKENFAPRDIIPTDTLAGFTERDNWHSTVRLTLHVAVILALVALTVSVTHPALMVATVLVLAGALAGTFAPFHECTHSTAFASANLNRLGGWIASLGFGMSPAYYREFHFAHHRHTQDPELDPELMSNPSLMLNWPTRGVDWFVIVSGWRLLRSKFLLMSNAWIRPRRFAEQISRWGNPSRAKQAILETRIVSVVWAMPLVGTMAGVPGALETSLALLLCHLFQGLWLSTEHTGLPTDGTILARTRSTATYGLIRWFLWNMNFHAEHHAWPAVPWYKLPATHRMVSDHVVLERTYLGLHRRIWNQRFGRKSDTR